MAAARTRLALPPLVGRDAAVVGGDPEVDRRGELVVDGRPVDEVRLLVSTAVNEEERTEEAHEELTFGPLSLEAFAVTDDEDNAAGAGELRELLERHLSLVLPPEEYHRWLRATLLEVSAAFGARLIGEDLIDNALATDATAVVE